MCLRLEGIGGAHVIRGCVRLWRLAYSRRVRSRFGEKRGNTSRTVCWHGRRLRQHLQHVHQARQVLVGQYAGLVVLLPVDLREQHPHLVEL